MVIVDTGEVRLAVTDHGGTGPPLVLMPGLGGTQRSLARLVPLLRGWRVVTLDLRGHGGSTTAPFDLAAGVRDLRAVVEQLGLERPVVGGHSLGGMLALQYALAGHLAAGVVNIDGWGPGLPERYVGEDLHAVGARLDRIATGDLGSPLARLVGALSRQSREGTTGQVLRALDRADVVGWHAAVPCPSLALHAIAPAGKVSAVLMGRTAVRLQTAHRDGLRRDLARLAASAADVTVVEVDATHALCSTHPAPVAAAIDAWWDGR